MVVKVLGRGPGTEDKRWCSLQSGRGRQDTPGKAEVEPEGLEGHRDQEPGAGQEVTEGQSAGDGGTQGDETQLEWPAIYILVFLVFHCFVI